MPEDIIESLDYVGLNYVSNCIVGAVIGQISSSSLIIHFYSRVHRFIVQPRLSLLSWLLLLSALSFSTTDLEVVSLRFFLFTRIRPDTNKIYSSIDRFKYINIVLLHLSEKMHPRTRQCGSIYRLFKGTQSIYIPPNMDFFRFLNVKECSLSASPSS